MNKPFPKDFFWGASTSSHQVEGNNYNSWSVWEESHENIQNSGIAADQYNRYEEDFDLAKQLGHNAHRLSLEWSRIEPEEGKFDEKELLHYKNVLIALKDRNIEPFVTLWHWPIPVWLEEKGGWENKEIAGYFERYVQKTVECLKEDAKFWITLNEPLVFTSQSYYKGNWPPQKRSLVMSIRVAHNLIKAHKLAFRAIKSIEPQLEVGIAKHVTCLEAYPPHLLNKLLRFFANYISNIYFLDRIKNFQDFIGINYYFHARINLGIGKNDDLLLSDLKWEIYPEGLYAVIKMIYNRYRKPLYITENGLADAEDRNRTYFIEESIRNMQRALEEDIDLRGYLHWSLIDNFEWAHGFWPKFGLIEIDRDNDLQRKIRKSAYRYAEIIKNNGIL